MSNLLEKAIVDANALKEVALKNAEQLVIEKYSREVKTAMDKILEQEEAGMGMDMGMDMGADMGLGGDPMADFGPDTEADPTMGNDTEDEEDDWAPDSLRADLPDAFNTDDDEIVTIKLDSLEADIEDDDGVFGGDDEFDDDEIGIDISDEDEEAEEEFEEDEIDFEDDSSGEIGVDITSDVVQEVLATLGLSEDEVDLEDLTEKVRVDFEPQKSGWAGTPEPIMKEYESMLLAREQDSEVKEENEELRKNVKALKQENKTLTSAAKKLQMQTEKYETAFNT